LGSARARTTTTLEKGAKEKEKLKKKKSTKKENVLEGARTARGTRFLDGRRGENEKKKRGRPEGMGKKTKRELKKTQTGKGESLIGFVKVGPSIHKVVAFNGSLGRKAKKKKRRGRQKKGKTGCIRKCKGRYEEQEAFVISKREENSVWGC